MELLTQRIWDDVLQILKPSLDKDCFETWFTPARFHSFNNDTLTLIVPSDLYRKWLLSNYYDQILAAVEKLTQRRPEIVFLTMEGDDDPEKAQTADSAQGKESPPKKRDLDFAATQLNSKYTFDRFVVGESNRFAHAAARAVSDPASRAYNPLFIYGGVGLGKTHLMQAIGHDYLVKSPRHVVLYVTSEQFMNAFIDAITKNKQYDFRNHYRNVDLLLLDDVQFFIGKEHTQTQFFHTFNALYDAGKKIVISSDRPPKELVTLEERLRSRFEWGLIVDIQPPDLETRIAILKKKAEMYELQAPDDVLVYVAERINSNIRFLEGALVRLQAYMTIHKKKTLNANLTREAIGDLMSKDMQEEASIAAIQNCVCEYFDIKLADMIGHNRNKKFSMPRHIAQYLCRKMTGKSLPDIAVHFGGRDHTSVLHACRKIENNLKEDHNLETMINYLTKNVKEKS
ncbi:chromosomal replication initiator protein DnaA [Candidatus Sumerlaeota bacterium]|nr:chromosomal replication initiator protein DnaA [Candidatus Sumerlaeota bacterium]